MQFLTLRLFQAPLLRSVRSTSSVAMQKETKRNFYAVRCGRQAGIYLTWAECKAQVDGYPNPIFRKFESRLEAEEFVNSSSRSQPQQQQPYTKSVYSNNNGRGFRVTEKNRTSHGVVLSSARASTTSSRAVTLRGDPATTAVEAVKEVVYTDGASSGNGKKGAKAGWGMYWGENDPRNGGGTLPGKRQTNQRAELYAVIRAMEKDIGGKTTLEIRTDSQYTINCIDVWSKKWIKNGWKSASSGKSVENRDLVERVLDLREVRPGKVIFSYVPGHSGVHGNEMADKLAVQGAAGQL